MALKPPRPLILTLSSEDETCSNNLRVQTLDSKEALSSTENQQSVKIDLSKHLHDKKSSLQTGSLQLSSSTAQDMQVFSQRQVLE